MNRLSLLSSIFAFSLITSHGLSESTKKNRDWQVPKMVYLTKAESIQAITKAVQNNDLQAIDTLLWQAVAQQQNVVQLLEATLIRFQRNVYETPGYKRLLEQGAVSFVQQSVLQKNLPIIQNVCLETLDFQTRPKEFFIDAIEALIQANLWPEDAYFFSRLQQEIAQISGLDALSAFDTFAICLKAQQALNQARQETTYLRRSHYNLNRSVIVDKKSQTFAILSKKHGDFQAEGAFKRVSSAIFVEVGDREVTLKRMVRIVNKKGKELSQKEINFELEYGNVKVMTSYPSKNDPTITKTSYIQEAYDHDLYQFTAYVSEDKQKGLSMSELVNIFSQIASEILEMHQKGAIHRDIKAKNILFRRVASGKIEIKICDYGHAFYPEKSTSKRARPKRHGTLRYSPPEALGGKAVSMPQSALLQALDMYGLANIMYELITVEPTPWGTYVWRALKKTGKRAEEAKDEALSRQKKTYKDLLDKTKNMPESIEKSLLQICAKLLDPNPKTRMTSNACVEKLLSVKTHFGLKEA